MMSGVKSETENWELPVLYLETKYIEENTGGHIERFGELFETAMDKKMLWRKKRLSKQHMIAKTCASRKWLEHFGKAERHNLNSPQLSGNQPYQKMLGQRNFAGRQWLSLFAHIFEFILLCPGLFAFIPGHFIYFRMFQCIFKKWCHKWKFINAFKMRGGANAKLQRSEAEEGPHTKSHPKTGNAKKKKSNIFEPT